MTTGTGREAIGIHIAKWREARGMTQEQLGALLGPRDANGVPQGRTKTYVSMIETGKRTVGKRARLFEFADALGIAVTDLTGQPYPVIDRPDAERYLVVPRVRAALSDSDTPIDPRPIAELEAVADLAMAARMHCDMNALGQHLPGLLAETRLLWFQDGEPAAGDLFVQACVTGALALKAAGYLDLAIRMSDHAMSVSAVRGNPIGIAAARFTAAQCALSTGSPRRAAELCQQGINDLTELARKQLPLRMLDETRDWLGLLYLNAALALAPVASDDADHHLTAGEVVLRSVQTNVWRMEPTVANARLWKVGAALENGNPESAPDLARRVTVTDLLTPQRQARLYLDTARGYHARGDHTAAIRSLLLAERAARHDLRSRPQAVDMTLHMLHAAPVRGGSSELVELALAVGVDPNSPPLFPDS